MHGLGIAGLGCGRIKTPRGIEVLLHPEALLVESAETKLRGREPLLGGEIEPIRGIGQILRHPAPFGIALRDLVFSGGIALGCGRPQSDADRCGQLVDAR